jgi:transposase-like protein
MVIALGVTLQGQKKILGFVQTATENEPVCGAFLRALMERGLRVEPGLLCIIDGAKRLRKAVQTVLGAQALVQPVSVAQARERGAISPEGSAGGLASAAATGL